MSSLLFCYFSLWCNAIVSVNVISNELVTEATYTTYP